MEQNTPYLEKQNEFFDDLISKDWNKYLNPSWNKKRSLEVKELFKITGNQVKNILDIGSGCGYHDLLMANFDHTHSIVGIDYSAKSIEEAEKHFPHQKISRSVVDIFDPKAMEQFHEKFDLAVSFQVIEHLKFPEKFFEINKNAVKKGGFVAIVTPNWGRLEIQIRSKLKMTHGYCDPMHFKEYSMEELIAYGKKFNLTVVGGFGHTYFFNLKGIPLLNWIKSFQLDKHPSAVKLSSVMGLVFKSE